MQQLAEDQQPDAVPDPLTMRKVPSRVNGIYDLLGLSTPITIKTNVMMKRLWMDESKELGWDDPIPGNRREEWTEPFRELCELHDVLISRSIKLQQTVGKPTLICDRSNEAYGACAYARWELSDGKFESRLIAAKTRVSPLKRMTIVRIELNGAVLAGRLASFLKKEM